MEDNKKNVSAKKFAKKLKKGMKSKTAKEAAVKKLTGYGRDLGTPLAPSIMTKPFFQTPPHIKKYK